MELMMQCINFIIELSKLEKILLVWIIAIIGTLIQRLIDKETWYPYGVYALFVSIIYTVLEVYFL